MVPSYRVCTFRKIGADMRIITIDFETYWNSKEKYSLAKMGPIEYIRDSRFYVQCMGFRIDHGQTFVVPAGHIRKTINALRLDDVDELET